ncbi:hypothetical protein QR98_0083430 [Sarcoptes scabiei]|uniref:Uncharacterized protein n=1 Tax=Sarcoptes scabiei TaxID=52283 RepID=A0A132AFN2_SARSC|nr:hypothetical protein QR98_0083430 [Sarcoptes scabiei]
MIKESILIAQIEQFLIRVYRFIHNSRQRSSDVWSKNEKILSPDVNRIGLPSRPLIDMKHRQQQRINFLFGDIAQTDYRSQSNTSTALPLKIRGNNESISNKKSDDSINAFKKNDSFYHSTSHEKPAISYNPYGRFRKNPKNNFNSLLGKNPKLQSEDLVLFPSMAETKQLKSIEINPKLTFSKNFTPTKQLRTGNFGDKIDNQSKSRNFIDYDSKIAIDKRSDRKSIKNFEDNSNHCFEVSDEQKENDFQTNARNSMSFSSPHFSPSPMIEDDYDEISASSVQTEELSNPTISSSSSIIINNDNDDNEMQNPKTNNLAKKDNQTEMEIGIELPSIQYENVPEVRKVQR